MRGGVNLTKVLILSQSVYYTHMHIRVGTQMYMYSQRIMCALVRQQWALPSHVGKGVMALKQCTIQADSSVRLRVV